MKPRDLEYFKQVADVIGEELAEYELQRVIGWDDCYDCEMSAYGSLSTSFIWCRSPQKRDFWESIDDGKNPYKHGHEKPDLSEITHANSDDDCDSRKLDASKEHAKVSSSRANFHSLLIGSDGEAGDKPTNKYKVLCKGVHLDVYDILLAYAVINPADQHAIKKMLMAGKRGVKDEIQDRKEAIQSLERAIELAMSVE